MTAAELCKPDWIAQYDTLVHRAGVVDLGSRTQIEATGADRATWLHNLCTNEIRKLAAGRGCEAFLTSVQGKTLGHVFIFAQEESLVIDTVPGQTEKLLAHLDHYLVCERVTLVDRGVARRELYLGGPSAPDVLRKLTPLALDPARLANAVTSLAGCEISLRRADLSGPDGFLIDVADRDAERVQAALLEAGALACSAPAFEAARIEAGFPLFGRDISDQNLPQEVSRDALAISFVKGCYLGQETVARIDALGHVNKMLVGVKFLEPEVPEPGCELLASGQSVGHVTSASFSPALGAPLAIALARRGSTTPGTRLETSWGAAEVVLLGAPR